MTTLSTDEIIGLARQAKSLMHRSELVWLIELARMAPSGTGVEVGVYCGASLIAWSLARDEIGSAIGVDNFAFPGMNPHPINIRAECEKNIQASHAPASLFDGDSVTVAETMPNDLAFVFIDGDHTSPAIDNDIAAWTPKIRSGGIVAFHDYGRRKNNCNVAAAVDAWQARDRWHELGKVETTIGFRKP